MLNWKTKGGGREIGVRCEILFNIQVEKSRQETIGVWTQEGKKTTTYEDDSWVLLHIAAERARELDPRPAGEWPEGQRTARASWAVASLEASVSRKGK